MFPLFLQHFFQFFSPNLGHQCSYFLVKTHFPLVVAVVFITAIFFTLILVCAVCDVPERHTERQKRQKRQLWPNNSSRIFFLRPLRSAFIAQKSLSMMWAINYLSICLWCAERERERERGQKKEQYNCVGSGFCFRGILARFLPPYCVRERKMLRPAAAVANKSRRCFLSLWSCSQSAVVGIDQWILALSFSHSLRISLSLSD